VNNFKKILDLLKRKGFCHYEPAVGGESNQKTRLAFANTFSNPLGWRTRLAISKEIASYHL